MKKLNIYFLTILLVFLTVFAKSQSLPVGITSGMEDYYRRMQLLGALDSATSFTVRPIFPEKTFQLKNPYYPDPTEDNYGKHDPVTSWQYKNGFSGMLLPLSVQSQINTAHPYGWNDGAMIPAKGLQALFSAGIYAKFGILSIQLMPEVVSAANTTFETLNKNHYGAIFARYYDFYNNIDLPVRFGTSSYNKAYWGQSSVRLNYKSLSFGLSTENLWWGPGIRNSLLMSNSAPGFKHLTLNTVKPIKTPVGSFEGQLIAGRLEGSGYGPLEPDSTHTYFNNPLYVPKPTDWRYLSGIVITWQPKWVPGLFLGLTSSAQLYSKGLKGIGSYLPIFSPFKKQTADQPLDTKDERSSLFIRWLWPEEHAEIYFEYGKNNNTSDIRNTALDPQDARAYIFGLRKILPTGTGRNEGVMIGIEATQLAETSTDKIANAQSWYVNSYIRQGYTQLGQSLGAGIGPGGNLQTLDVSWFKGLKRIGVQFERYIHNDDLYYYIYTDSNDWRRHWVDLSASLSGEWNYHNFIFNAKIQGVQSFDYQWYIDPKLEIVGAPYYHDGETAFNLQLQAGLTYRF